MKKDMNEYKDRLSSLNMVQESHIPYMVGCVNTLLFLVIQMMLNRLIFFLRKVERIGRSGRFQIQRVRYSVLRTGLREGGG